MYIMVIYYNHNVLITLFGLLDTNHIHQSKPCNIKALPKKIDDGDLELCEDKAMVSLFK